MTLRERKREGCRLAGEKKEVDDDFEEGEDSTEFRRRVVKLRDQIGY